MFAQYSEYYAIILRGTFFVDLRTYRYVRTCTRVHTYVFVTEFSTYLYTVCKKIRGTCKYIVFALLESV